MFITWPFSLNAALAFRAVLKLCLLLAAVAVMFLAGVALAQAGDSPTAPHTATPVTTQPVIVPVMTPAAPAVAQQAPAPSWSWGDLIAGVFLALVAWFVKNVQPKVHAALNAFANDPSRSAPVRTLVHLADDLEPLVVSMVGHIVPDVQAAVAAGKDPGTVTKAVSQAMTRALLHPPRCGPHQRGWRHLLRSLRPADTGVRAQARPGERPSPGST